MAGNVLHLVSHTHWDREWYISLGSFRVRLVSLLDNLLEVLQRDSVYRHFHLDGQTILLEDYLSVRPERRDTIRNLVQAGRLSVGPWYTALDETLVSGESIVRNLLYGLRDSASFGPACLVGYLPDQFGHVSQLPQILRGFGIQDVVIGRGINRASYTNEFRWRSGDGSEVFGLFLNQWYSNARNIPQNPQEAAEYLKRAAQQAAQYACTPHLLLMNGVDHMEAQPDLGDILTAVRPLLDDELVHDSLQQTLAEARQAAATSARQPALFQGELRQDLGGRLDAGTLSARMPLKLANFAVTQLIERVAEPLATLAHVAGGPNLIALVDEAWRALLQNHPHDSICGCSIDAVAEQMAARFAHTADVALGVAERAVQALAPSLGYTGAPGEALVYNPAPVPADGVHILTIDLPLTEPTRSPITQRTNPERTVAPVEVTVRQADGTSCPAQLLSMEETERLVLAPLHLPRTQLVQRIRLAAQVPIPAFGITRVTAEVHPAKQMPALGLAVHPGRLENEHLIVEVSPDNALYVTHKATGRLLGPVHVIEDTGDAGDTYHYIRPESDVAVYAARATSVAQVENGPLAAAFCLRYDLHIPKELDTTRRARTSTTVPLTLYVTVRLRKESPWVEFTTTLDNNAQDHRLRVILPSGVEAEMFTSGTQFGAVERPVTLPAAWVKAAKERPQWGWSDISQGDFGVAVLTRGITEVEPVRCQNGLGLALTLLRCVGAVSRQSATPLVLAAPGAQCRGSHSFSYALYPHGGDWRASQTPQMWERFAATPVVFQPRPAQETTGPNSACQERQSPWRPVSADTDGFLLTAVKAHSPVDASAQPVDLVVRGYSFGNETLTVPLQVERRLLRAYRLSLAEAVEEELPVNDNTVFVPVAPHQIVTVGVVFATDETTGRVSASA